MNDFLWGAIVLLKLVLLREISLLSSWVERYIRTVIHMEVSIVFRYIRAMSDYLRPVKGRVSTIEALKILSWNVQVRDHRNKS